MTLVVVLVLAAIVIGQQVWIATRPHPIKVLDYPEQTVVSRIPGSDFPSVMIGQDLEIIGTKCVIINESIKVSGRRYWISVAPAGSVIPGLHEAGVRHPGCNTQDYTIPLNPDVVARTQEITRRLDIPCMTWRFTGRMEPDNSENYRPETWQTEPFNICVRAP